MMHGSLIYFFFNLMVIMFVLNIQSHYLNIHSTSHFKYIGWQLSLNDIRCFEFLNKKKKGISVGVVKKNTSLREKLRHSDGN